MQSSVSGFIFAGAIFAVAIPVAIFTSNRGILKGGRSFLMVAAYFIPENISFNQK